MPIDSVHPQYKEFEGVWQMCRDAYDGERAVKSRGVRYLPRLEGQAERDYLSYLTRASFFGITERTVSAMVGMATYKPMVVRAPDELLPYVSDSDGAQFGEILSSTIRELLLMGRYALLVDAPVGGGAPFIATYQAEAVRNWRVGADGLLDWVVLLESEHVQSASDKFVQTSELQYRLLERTVDGVTVTVLNQKKEVVSGPRLMLTAANQPVRTIPLTIATPRGLGAYVIKPPMEDIVSLNLSHYRTSADLEWGRHICGLPTPVVSGTSDDKAVLRIGGTTAWILPDSQAKAYYLEFTGQGLQSLENSLKEKQGQLASMSARLLDQSTRGSEAADAVRLRYLSETASLAEVVRSAQQALLAVSADLQTMLAVTGTTEIVLPTDFLAARLGANDIKAIFDAYFRGGLSKESLVYNLRRGDLLDPTRTDEQEMAVIAPPTGNQPTGVSNA